MTPNPAFTERNIQKANIVPTFLSGAKLWLHSIKLRHRFWPVNALTSSAPIGFPIICVWAPADICEQWEGNLTARFSRHSWGRKTWRTLKNLSVGGYTDTPLIRTLCLAPSVWPTLKSMGFDCKNVKKINELRTKKMPKVIKWVSPLAAGNFSKKHLDHSDKIKYLFLC